MDRIATARKGGTPQPKTRLEAARAEVFGPGRPGLLRFARRMRRCPAHCRQIELHGRAPLGYAQEAQRHLRCHMNLFMWPDWTPTPESSAGEEQPTTKPKGPEGGRAAVERTPELTGRTPNARRLLAQEAANLAHRGSDRPAVTQVTVPGNG